MHDANCDHNFIVQPISLPNYNMKNYENTQMYEITQEEVEAYAWSADIKAWIGIAMNYIEITDKLANIMLENFATTASYRYNANIIKRAIIEGLPTKMKDIMLSSELVTKKRSKEQKTLMTERHNVQKKVILMYLLC
jgi:hypothetical protein